MQNLCPSELKGSSKSAFPDFHGNRLEFSNSAFALPTPDPDRLSMPNSVEIRRETREEMRTNRLRFTRWATKTGDYYIDFVYLQYRAEQIFCDLLHNMSVEPLVPCWTILVLAGHFYFKISIKPTSISPPAYDKSSDLWSNTSAMEILSSYTTNPHERSASNGRASCLPSDHRVAR